MKGSILRIGFLATAAALLITAGCVTINVPASPAQSSEPTQPTTPAPTTQPTVPTQPTMPTIATVPVQPTLPVKPIQPLHPTLVPSLPALQPDLASTTWTLESMGTPGQQTPALTVTQVTLDFSADGHVSGNAGCNAYTGSYQSTLGGELSISGITSTHILCVKPGVANQEYAFLDGLEASDSYTVTGGKLTITGGGQMMVLS